MRKRKRLNKNAIPFLVLAFIHFSMVIILILRKRKKNTWLLLLSNIGFAYLFEYIVLNVFQAYKYKPSIIKKRYLDNIFGAILSQGIFVPITSTLLTVLNKGWEWKIGFSIYFYIIENLFLKLKIYKVNWWNPLYTLLLIPLYFYISDYFYKALNNKKKWSMKVAHYLSNMVIGINLLYVSALFRRIRFGRGYHHSWKEHFVVAPLYSLLLNGLLLKFTSKPGILPNLRFLGIGIIIDQTFVYFGILKMNFKQSLRTIPIHILMIMVSRFFYFYIYKKDV